MCLNNSQALNGSSYVNVYQRFYDMHNFIFNFTIDQIDILTTRSVKFPSFIASFRLKTVNQKVL